MRILLIGILCILCNYISAQSVSGVLVDSKENPIENASISILGEETGVYSDVFGEFSLIPKQRGLIELQISHISYSNKIISENYNGGDLELGIISLEENLFVTEELIITAVRGSEQTPVSQTTISKEQLEAKNLGKDVPTLLKNSPSLIMSSDAGNGVGYSYLRIRGTDQSRINVTINGIPYNDAESQQVFWVDLPDITSSLKDIQVQRGLGSSTHGAGAFGGSIHLNSLFIEQESFVQLDNSFGSYNTRKHGLQLNSGLLGAHWNFSGRLSFIKSDGYVDRSSSDLKSYYVKASYIDDKSAIHFTHFSGKEVTYQSWYGTPEALVKDDEVGIQAFIDRNFIDETEAQRLNDAGRRYNFYTYENQVDDYKQDHYSVHLSRNLDEKLSLSAALHYTYGRGFFEEFKPFEAFLNYGLEEQLINGTVQSEGDIVRQRWLRNHYYGAIFNVKYNPLDKLEWIIGGATHFYDGDHFGDVILIEDMALESLPFQYYSSKSDKNDFNIYNKFNFSFTDAIHGYLDLQLRHVDYKTAGNDNDLKSFDISRDFLFFNPKLGVQFAPDKYQSFSAYLGLGHREPDRNDFVDQFPLTEPEAEKLLNLELAYSYKARKFQGEFGLYWMDYKNQLVLSGDLNDVGAPLRLNVPESYRIGMEFSIDLQLHPKISIQSNLNLSQNKISRFEEILFDYGQSDPAVVINEHEDTDISFSPGIVSSTGIQFKIAENASVELISKYVGKQFLDNTSDESRQLDAYFVGDLVLYYQPTIKALKNIKISFQLNNIWNALYSANGYTYSYIYGDLITENFLYPQAERNVLAGLSLRF